MVLLREMLQVQPLQKEEVRPQQQGREGEVIKTMLCILMGLPTPGEKALHTSNYELRWAKAITNATPCVQREDGSVYVCPECDGCVVIYTVTVGEKSPRPGGRKEEGNG